MSSSDSNTKYWFQRDIDFAEKVLREKGELMCVSIGHTEDNKVIYIPMPFRNDKEKDFYINMVKLTFLAMGVVRYVHMSETWVSTVPMTHQGDYPRPSQDPQRIEALLVAGVTHEEVSGKMMQMIRDSSGKLTELRPWNEMNLDMQGRMVELLPPKELIAQADLKTKAYALLKEFKMVVDPLHPDIFYDPSRTVH